MKKLYQQLIVMSGYAAWCLLLLGVCCSSLATATALQDKVDAYIGMSIEDVPIKVGLRNESLRTVVAVLERESGFHFAYAEKVLDKYKGLNIDDRQQTLADVLRQISQETNLAFKRVYNNIHISETNPGGERLKEVFLPVQQFEVTGKVTDHNNGTSLPGVTILEKGTTNGTASDSDGNYRIAVSSGDAILVFSSIGYSTEEVAVSGRTEVNVTLSESIQSLEQVVVVGYTTQQRKDLTSSVGSVDVASLQRRAVTDVTQGLQGTVTGVNITPTDGNPGSALNFNIRGISTLGAGESNPLVIVDGVQITGLQDVDFENTLGDATGTISSTGLENLNPNDIESIEILKDASAAAIYGSRAANGVVIVTTKRGRKGKPVISYNNYLGVQSPYKNTPVTNTAEYIQILQGMYGDELADPNVPQAARDYLANPSAFNDYNWQDLVYDNAFMQSHDLSVSGGGDMGNFRISTGYLDQDGITLSTGYKRYNLRANSDFQVSERVTVGQRLSLANTRTTPEPFSFSRSVYYQALKMYPYFSPTTPDGEWNTTSFYWGGGTNPENHIRNPFHYNSLWHRDVVGNNISANLYADIGIAKGLKYRISGAYALAQLKTHTQFGDKRNKPGEYFNDNKSIEESFVEDSNWNIDHLLTFTRTFGKHNFDLMAGFVAQKFKYNSLSGSKSNYISDITSTLGGPGGMNANTSGTVSESSLLSLLGKLFYSYDDRYLLTLNFRRDGSSRFAKDYRWGNFPGLSVGWRLSAEDFWENSGLGSVVTDAKFRAGYGQLGRQNVGDYDYLPTLVYEPVVFGSGIHTGLITGTPINQAVTWELLVSRNIGVDFELLDGQFYGSFEYYHQRTEDMIIGVPTEPSAGGGELQSNVGKILNRGVEATLGFAKSQGDFSYNIGFNLTTTNTTLEEIGSDLIFRDYLAPEWDVPPAIIIYRGRGPAQFWLIKTDGIFKSQEEVEAHRNSQGQIIQPDAQPGDIRFVDANDDGEISEEGDRQYMGSGVPNLNLGFNATATYRNFDFNIGLYGAFGHKILNGPLYLLEQNYGFGNYSTRLLDAFDPVTNPDSNFPRLNASDAEENWNSRPTSDRYLEDGDFVKVRNLEFGYRFPAGLLEKIYVRSARVFVRSQNLFTITGYSGNDPEMGRDGFFNAGIDRGQAPQARSFQLGFNLEF